MTRCCLRLPMRWSVAIGAIGRCKRVCTGCATRPVERAALPWTCSENRALKAEIKPPKRYTRPVGDAHDTESLLQCLKARYFRNDGHWTFWEGKAELVKPDKTPITRFTKVTGKNSPYDPTLRQYWLERRKRQVGRETYAKQRLMLHQRQGYRCALCTIPFVPGEDIETDHIIPTSQGGTDDISNKRLVHPWCHRQRHQKDGRQRLRA